MKASRPTSRGVGASFPPPRRSFPFGIPADSAMIGRRHGSYPRCREGGGLRGAENGRYADSQTALIFPIVPWLESIRGASAFHEILQRASARSHDAEDEFRRLGGEKILL